MDRTSFAQDEGDDEALSQPNDPHVGMRYDTLEGVKEHYNAYAARTGFSVKANTSRKSVFTGQLEKLQFVCNKFRKPKGDVVGAERPMDTGPIIDTPPEEDEDDVQNRELASVVAGIAEQGQKKKKPKERKRENIIPRGCKAKMVVKLIDGRWEVVQFEIGRASCRERVLRLV